MGKVAVIEGFGAFGIARVGVSDASAGTAEQDARVDSWIERGFHAGMGYMEKYRDVRADCRELLPGAQSVISCAFPYYNVDDEWPAELPYIARYARGKDYHEVVREWLEAFATAIREAVGGETRVCVDTAPIHERHRAVMSGVGFTGCNGLLIVPGMGSYFFLGEILTTVRFEPTPALDIDCGSCGLCVKACPGKALDGSGAVDARRCLSYMTIEHRGDFPDGFTTGGRLVGCDTCQVVCPHNREPLESAIAEFSLRPEYKKLTPGYIQSMTQGEFSTIFSHSAIKRLKLEGLKRNSKCL